MTISLRASAAVLVAVAAILSLQAAGKMQARHVFVQVVDAHGAPVSDLTTSDFPLTEGGVSRVVTHAGPATDPMRIALFLDTSDAASTVFSHMRAGAIAFLDALPPDDRAGCSPTASARCWWTADGGRRSLLQEGRGSLAGVRDLHERRHREQRRRAREGMEHHHRAAREDEGARRATRARSPQDDRLVRGGLPDRFDRVQTNVGVARSDVRLEVSDRRRIQ